MKILPPGYALDLGSASLTWESSGSITIVLLAFKVSTRPHCSSSLSAFLTVDAILTG